jgi:hydrophobic/amphiphilic exporter-1 (mainly G- bacteria), HAE1 family
MMVLFFAGLGLTYLVFTRVPTGFVPDEDQGYFIIVIQAPSGASLEYTKAIGKQVSDLLAMFRKPKEHSRLRASVSPAAPRIRELFSSRLKPYSQRKGEEHTASAILNRVRPRLFGDFRSNRVCHAASAIQRAGPVRRIPIRGAGSGFAHA